MACEANAEIDSGTSCRRSERRVAVTITSCSTPSARGDSVCECAVCIHAAPGIDRIAEIAALSSRDTALEGFLFSPVMTHPTDCIVVTYHCRKRPEKSSNLDNGP